MEWNTNSKTAVAVIIIILILAILSKWTISGENNSYSNEFIKQCCKLVKQAVYWHNLARQDQNQLLALLHSTYALSYARIAKTLGKPETISRVTKINIEQFIQKLEKDQEEYVNTIIQICPSINPGGKIMSVAGWV